MLLCNHTVNFKRNIMGIKIMDPLVGTIQQGIVYSTNVGWWNA